MLKFLPSQWISGILAFAAIGTASAVGAHGQDLATPLNYEAQALAIFQAASGYGGPVGIKPKDGPLDAPQKRAINRIYAGLKAHTIFLKNVVWRPDLKVIRLTWANNDNSLVFKIVYKVAHDPVLTNSIYANKNEIVDVKIMFLQDGRYRYLHLDNTAGSAKIIDGRVIMAQAPQGWHATGQPVDPAYGVYTLNGHMSDAQCKFCHMLVPGVNGKPGGVFFPRYQEASVQGEAAALRTPSFFRADEFRPINPVDAPIKLPDGLPNPVLFNRVDMGAPGTNSATYTMYARTMFESPELVEALARDNHDSVCISVDFGAAAPLFGKDNYVCADGVRRKIFVKFKNPMLSTGDGDIEYEKPYYADH